jgi:hypothetical protein
MISLGEYDPTRFQLLYMVLVSKRGAPEFHEEQRANRKHIYFNNFRVSIIWSFMSLPSDIASSSIRLGTLRSEEIEVIKDPFHRLIETMIPIGFSPYRCIPEFAALRPLLKSEYINGLVNRHRGGAGVTAEDLQRARQSATIVGEFFKKGTGENTRYNNHMRRCEFALRADPLFNTDELFQLNFPPI